MLPGVELARRRRLHQRAATTAAAVDASPAAIRPNLSSSSMGEAALLARRRLRERLRGPEPAITRGPGYSFSSAPLMVRSDASSSFTNDDGDRRGRRPSAINASKKKKKNGSGKGSKLREAGAADPSLGVVPTRDTAAVRREPSVAEDVCAVCLDALSSRSQTERKPLVNLPCSHNYHFDCVRTWLASNYRCPCCRKAVVSL